MSVVEFNGVHLNINKDEILRNLNIHMETGKIYGLLGRNGAGKTSLLSLLASYREVTKGELTVDGEIPFENERVMERVRFTYEQDYSEWTETPETMVEQYKAFISSFDEPYAYELLNGFGVDTKKELHKLSKGQQSAINAVLGLASLSAVTIFDEVTSGMDAPAREYFYKQLLNAKDRESRTFVVSTHIVSEMDYLFDEVIIIHRGKVLLQEPIDELLSRGVRITGKDDEVEQFTKDMHVLSTEFLGPTRSDMVLGELPAEEVMKLDEGNLDISEIRLQELFIHLTDSEEANDE